MWSWGHPWLLHDMYRLKLNVRFCFTLYCRKQIFVPVSRSWKFLLKHFVMWLLKKMERLLAQPLILSQSEASMISLGFVSFSFFYWFIYCSFKTLKRGLCCQRVPPPLDTWSTTYISLNSCLVDIDAGGLHSTALTGQGEILKRVLKVYFLAMC